MILILAKRPGGSKTPGVLLFMIVRIHPILAPAHQLAQVHADLLRRRPAHEPPAVVNLVDGALPVQDEGVGDLYLSLDALCRQPALSTDGRLATLTGRGDDLSEHRVLHLAGCEDARHAGHHRIVSDQVVVVVHPQLALEKPGVGIVADVNEHAVGRQLLSGSGLDVLDRYPFHFPVAEHLSDFTFGQQSLDRGVEL